jgi:tRNA A37 threonylcarbamoyladenosine modification protein TsaB
VVDARRGEVFVARLRVSASGLVWEQPEGRAGPDALAAELAALGEPVVLTGNGARRYHDTLGAVPGARCAGDVFDFPAPGVSATLAVARAGAGQTTDLDAVLPHYLRDAETRINWQTRAPRAGVGG